MKNKDLYDKYSIDSYPSYFYTVEAVDKYNDKIEKYCRFLKDGSVDLSLWQKIKRRFYVMYLTVYDSIVYRIEMANSKSDCVWCSAKWADEAEDINSTDTNKPFPRILVLCDLHYLEEGELDAISSLKYDFCVLLGDIPPDALARITELVSKPIFAVAGNHDTRGMYEHPSITYINGRCVDVNGLTIAGIEGSNRYKQTPELVMLTQEESVALAERMPGANILISHDSCFEKYGTSPNKLGLKGISLYIDKYSPKLHLHGHYHIYDKYMIGATQCLACYRCMVVSLSGNTEVVF